MIGGVATGKAAVDAAQAVQQMKQAAAVPPAAPAAAQGVARAAVKYAGGKTFYYDPASGYWIDADYREGLREVFVRYLGDIYTELVASRPDIARWLAVGEKVKIAIDGIGLVIAPDVEDTLPREQIPRLGVE